MPEMSEGHEETDEFNVINIPMVVSGIAIFMSLSPFIFRHFKVNQILAKPECAMCHICLTHTIPP
jgi:hypothetical protein